MFWFILPVLEANTVVQLVVVCNLQTLLTKDDLKPSSCVIIKLEIAVPIMDKKKWEHENISRLAMFNKKKNPKHVNSRMKGIILATLTLKFSTFILSITIINPFHLSVNSLTDTVIGLLFPVSTIIS